MPYEYRKLSQTERQEVVEIRKQRGFPLHAPPHPFRDEGTFLITAANFEHKMVMTAPERKTEFQEILLRGFHEIKAEIIGWVILSNHYHILATVESLNLISSLLQYLHGKTSRDWNSQDSMTGKRKIWYRFSDRLMRDEAQLNQALNYVHYNPVKHGYVKDVYDWPWSSLLTYEEDKGKEWLRESWKKYAPPADFGKRSEL